jgi:hypothetical protein
MRIDAGSHLSQQAVPVKDVKQVFPSPVSFAGAAADAPSAGVTTTDFTGMTRQQLFDWMNSRIKSGALSLADSSPFLGMTVKIDAQTMQPVDMATDTSRVNFMDRAKQGIAGALSRGDQEGAARLRSALATMQRLQGEVSGVDIRA